LFGVLLRTASLSEVLVEFGKSAALKGGGCGTSRVVQRSRDISVKNRRGMFMIDG